MTTITRRGALGVAASLLATPALAQGRFPNRPIRFLIPWPPGGSLDALHRQMFEIMNKDLGQPVLIENKPGARGTQAALFLINQAQPDGYTLAHHHLSILRHPFLTKQKTWDPIADFSYVMQVSGFLFGTAVRADSPYKTFRDLIEAARKSPGKLTFRPAASPPPTTWRWRRSAPGRGVEMTHIPYRGSQEGVTALLGKQIDVVADSSSWRPNVEGGELRLLSVWTRERLAAFPDRRRCATSATTWWSTSPYGITGPKGMDPELVEFLHRAFRKAYEDEASQAIIRRWDMPKEYLPPAEYLAFAKQRVEYEKAMVARLGLSID